MKKLLLGTAMCLAAVPGALAADLPPAPAPAPVYSKAPPPAYNWTGFYIGGNVGGAWGSFDPSTTAVTPYTYFATANGAAVTSAGAQSIKPSAVTGGFEAGLNWQTSNLVFGIEGDIESFHLSGSATSGPIVYPVSAPSTFTVSSNASTTWLATARGRLGVAANNWLFFATGGAAFTNLGGNFAFTDNFGAGEAEAVSLSNTKTGYTVGGGIEAGLWGRWTAKAEYLYVDFGTVSGTGSLSNVPTQFLTHSIDLKANIARVGLNYRF